MSDKTEHSPLPWQQRDGYMFDCNDEPVPLRPIFGVGATEPGGLRYEDALANAEILARVTSMHERLVAALKELHALVRGECPSLLDEDSGGCARLDMEITGLLASIKEQSNA